MSYIISEEMFEGGLCFSFSKIRIYVAEFMIHHCYILTLDFNGDHKNSFDFEKVPIFLFIFIMLPLCTYVNRIEINDPSYIIRIFFYHLWLWLWFMLICQIKKELIL